MPLDRTPWTDDTVFEWGDHKGSRIGDVDTRYLLWLYEQKWIRDWPGLFAYLEANKKRILAAREEECDDPTRMDTYSTFEDYLRDTRGY